MAGFEPAASSSRSQVGKRAASTPAHLTCEQPSITVRWCPSPAAGVVTQLVTRLAGLGQTTADADSIPTHPPCFASSRCWRRHVATTVIRVETQKAQITDARSTGAPRRRAANIAIPDRKIAIIDTHQMRAYRHRLRCSSRRDMWSLCRIRISLGSFQPEVAGQGPGMNRIGDARAGGSG